MLLWCGLKSHDLALSQTHTTNLMTLDITWHNQKGLTIIPPLFPRSTVWTNPTASNQAAEETDKELTLRSSASAVTDTKDHFIRIQKLQSGQQKLSAAIKLCVLEITIKVFKSRLFLKIF